MKHVEAFVDVMACSAGYYIASQATKITAAPSATIGSIGVYMAVIDASRAMEMEGIAVQMISAGKFKGMGAPWKPLSDEEKAMLQSEVDSIYSAFKAAVTSARPQVSDATMQGQWFSGLTADDLYLVDELTIDTLDERLSRLLV
jgi:protease-4